MARTTVPVEVAAATWDLGESLAAVFKTVMDELDKGWNPLTDIPMLIEQAIKEFATVAKDVPLVKQEWATDRVAAVRAIELSVTDALEKYLTPAPTPAPTPTPAPAP